MIVDAIEVIVDNAETVMNRLLCRTERYTDMLLDVKKRHVENDGSDATYV